MFASKSRNPWKSLSDGKDASVTRLESHFNRRKQREQISAIGKEYDGWNLVTRIN